MSLLFFALVELMWDGDTTARHSLKLLGLMPHQASSAGVTSWGYGMISDPRTEPGFQYEIDKEKET